MSSIYTEARRSSHLQLFWVSQSVVLNLCTIFLAKMLTVTLVLCATVALATADDAAANHTELFASQCPPNWQKHNQRCFYFESSTKNWVNAEKQCQTMGGNLASIHQDDEHKFLQTLSQAEAWIGGSDCQTAGNWLWSDGTGMSGTFWCPQKPDDTLDECCLQTNSQIGKCWDDVACNTLLPFVCAKPL
ncbi:type-2 ice-structuring protein-like isoform X1 [Nerophis ophidion]|uniref:type-2 ice-structuring protein-like isoform X1 n=1 Tax=Nerophis ophidion TaxID=159077 RepID=UPI002AE06CAE|nr:type-2 ice-structuring protein-like isoform X1 [Nerophis ophidion]